MTPTHTHRKKGWEPELISDEHLEVLINGLEECAKHGVIDPWVLSDGTQIEPLHVLWELQAYRKHHAALTTGGEKKDG